MKRDLEKHKKFKEYFTEYHQSLFLFALRFIAEKEIASDMVQEAFLELWSYAQTKEQPNNTRAFLYAAVRNRCINYIRHKKIIDKHSENIELELYSREISHLDRADKALMKKEQIEELNKAIYSLPPKYREIILLNRFQEKSCKEISELLEMPIRTVESRVYRALCILKERIKDTALILWLFQSVKK